MVFRAVDKAARKLGTLLRSIKRATVRRVDIVESVSTRHRSKGRRARSTSRTAHEAEQQRRRLGAQIGDHVAENAEQVNAMTPSCGDGRRFWPPSSDVVGPRHTQRRIIIAAEQQTPSSTSHDIASSARDQDPIATTPATGASNAYAKPCSGEDAVGSAKPNCPTTAAFTKVHAWLFPGITLRREASSVLLSNLRGRSDFRTPLARSRHASEVQDKHVISCLRSTTGIELCSSGILGCLRRREPLLISLFFYENQKSCTNPPHNFKFR